MLIKVPRVYTCAFRPGGWIRPVVFVPMVIIFDNATGQMEACSTKLELFTIPADSTECCIYRRYFTLTR